jgi:hypothetical protein
MRSSTFRGTTGLHVDSFIVEKCKVINSKKKPFGRSFIYEEPLATELIHQLFKVWDDIRHEQLTLQMMNVTNHLTLLRGPRNAQRPGLHRGQK